MVTMRNVNVTIWSYLSIFANSHTSWDVGSCETSDVRVWFAELGWVHCLLGWLKAATGWVLFLNWRRSKCLGRGKTGGQKHIRKLGIHFVSIRGNYESCSYCINCRNPLFDLSHWLDLIGEQNIKESEEDQKHKAVFAPRNPRSAPLESGFDFSKHREVLPPTSVRLRSNLSGIQTLETAQLNTNNLPWGNSTNLLFT